MNYFDGCSYVHGHNDTTWGQSWAYKLFPKEKNINLSMTAKCNDNIFFDFVNHYNDLKEGDRVFIHWSHSERMFIYTGIAPEELPHTLDLDHHKNMAGESTAWRKNWYRNWFGYIIKTSIYMKAVLDLCLAKNIKPVFITTENYHWFKKATSLSIHNHIEELEPYVYNWPLDDVVEHHPIRLGHYENNTFSEFIFNWCLTNTVVSTALALSLEHNHRFLSEDHKHLNAEGHILFLGWIKDYIENRDHDLSYQISKLSPRAAKVYRDPLHGADYFKSTCNSEHWIESRVIDELTEISKKSSEYVYE